MQHRQPHAWRFQYEILDVKLLYRFFLLSDAACHTLGALVLFWYMPGQIYLCSIDQMACLASLSRHTASALAWSSSACRDCSSAVAPLEASALLSFTSSSSTCLVNDSAVVHFVSVGTLQGTGHANTAHSKFAKKESLCILQCEPLPAT